MPSAVSIVLASAVLVSAGGYKRPREPKKHPIKHYNFPEKWLAEPTPPMADLPEDFTWADVGGRNFLTPNWNQHINWYCGGCYLHSTLSTVQDRMYISKKGAGLPTMLARQTFINCGSDRGYGGGCDGGEVTDVLQYLAEYGLPDETCQVYLAKNGVCDDMGQCMNCMPTNYSETGTSTVCWPVKPYVTYKVKGFNLIEAETKEEEELAIKSEIVARGPVTCGFFTGEMFDFNYAGGVWKEELDELDHDVEVVGWGTDKDGTPYWHVRNSWGSYWGENGFFKVKRGLERGIVTYDCWFAVPDISDEAPIQNGVVSGSMYGLRSKWELDKVLSTGTGVVTEAAPPNPPPQSYTKLAQVQPYPLPVAEEASTTLLQTDMVPPATSSTSWMSLVVGVALGAGVGFCAGANYGGDRYSGIKDLP